MQMLPLLRRYILPAYLVGSGLKHHAPPVAYRCDVDSPGLFSREWIETIKEKWQ